MSSNTKPREKRFGERRRKADRREDIRWEPAKPVRRASDGRRQNDHWSGTKKP